MGGQKVVHRVSLEQAGCTLDNLLRHKLGFSRALVRRLKREGEVLLNGTSTLLRARVEPGDLVVVNMPRDQETQLIPDLMPLEIVYEDQDLLVIHKPAGMLVHPVHRENRGTLANGVLYHWRQQGVQDRFRPVIRLDRDTSGLVLVARGQHNARLLAGQVARGEMRRRYLAVVQGILPGDLGTIDLPLALKPGHTAQWMVDPRGKRAVTHYQRLRSLAGAALLLLELETGRTHQIRVHLSHSGHPLLGDARYGADPKSFHRQALHAAALDFTHPGTGRPMQVRAPLPRDMRQLLQQLSVPG